MNEELRKRYIADVSKLANRLEQLEIGDEITYVELSELIGIDVQTEGYRALDGARRMLRKSGKEYYTIRGVGIRRATDEDCLDMLGSKIKTISRRARDGIRINSNIPDAEKLSPSEKARISACNTIFAITIQATKPKRQRELGIMFANNPALLTSEAAKRTLEGIK